MEKMIERRKVIAYLRYLARHTGKGMSPRFRELRPEVDDNAVTLLAAGLMATAKQIEEGLFDKWEG